jgi:hypothetical protein
MEEKEIVNSSEEVAESVSQSAIGNRQSAIIANRQSPGLTALAFFGRRFDQRKFFGQFPAHLLLENLAESDVSGAQVSEINQQGPAANTSGGIQLSDAAGDEVYQHVGVAHFVQRLAAEIAIHSF